MRAMHRRQSPSPALARVEAVAPPARPAEAARQCSSCPSQSFHSPFLCWRRREVCASARKEKAREDDGREGDPRSEASCPRTKGTRCSGRALGLSPGAGWRKQSSSSPRNGANTGQQSIEQKLQYGTVQSMCTLIDDDETGGQFPQLTSALGSVDVRTSVWTSSTQSSDEVVTTNLETAPKEPSTAQHDAPH